jgi:hypothetical protein
MVIGEVEGTFTVELVLPDGTLGGTCEYESPDGRLPYERQVIPVDEGGGSARVTSVRPDGDPPIRAEPL